LRCSTPGAPIVAAADAQQHDRDTQLSQMLKALAAEKRSIVTPAQIASALTHERDDAVRLAKGGSAWRRFGRAAKWLLNGAGAVAAKATR
jgi:hypothetical protein